MSFCLHCCVVSLNVFSLLTLMAQVFLDLGLSTTVTAPPVSSWFIFLTKE